MLKLLVVDDSNVIRSRISRVVKYRDKLKIELVGVAKNGAEALFIASKEKIDVVTMDITMPKMDGLETIERMLKMDSQIRILVVSALDDKGTAISALRLGACGFLGKPFTDEELLISLLDAVDIH
jgi:Response regulator containing CheY-like receiver domain and AraC-type DNA-binding domain